MTKFSYNVICMYSGFDINFLTNLSIRVSAGLAKKRAAGNKIDS
jgi:hypothetical protein